MNGNILLVDDNPGMIQIMARILGGIADLRFATSGPAALEQARSFPPDLILLDAEMPGMDGYAVCEALKADPALRDAAVIFVTAHSESEFELKGLEVGAVDFIAKPISEQLLLARVKTHLRMKRLTDELRHIAAIDALTEAVNRRTLDESLEREWKRGLRAGEPISVLMIDVDHFKQFNDRYGHPAGDSCLRGVSRALKSACRRPADLLARYGGEEFALLLPQTARAGAEHMAHRVLDLVEGLSIPHESSGTANHLTVSVGIGCYDENSTGWARPQPSVAPKTDAPRAALDLVIAADQALYTAKRAGRAQAWFLDIDNVQDPGLAMEIAPWRRERRLRVAA